MSDMSVLSFIGRMDEAFRDGDPLVDSKSTEAQNVAHVRRQFEAISRGDFAAFAESLADDVELVIHAGPDIPFRGRCRGRRAVADQVRWNFGIVLEQLPEIHGLCAQGDMVVVFGSERGRFRSDNREYQLAFVQVHTVRDGQTVRFRQYVSDVADGEKDVTG
jgi:ketosteroid isomerase-like protein